MLKLFSADGTVKQEFPGAVSVQYVGRKALLWSAKTIVAEVTLQDGETIVDADPVKFYMCHQHGKQIGYFCPLCAVKFPGISGATNS
jgi:hypothetical protein